MENATKALLIAAGVLIGVMILSLAVALYSKLDSYVKTSQEEIKFNEISAFNAQFTKYLNGNQSYELKIQDVVTVVNLAHENNVKYNIFEQIEPSPSSLYVAVSLDGRQIDGSTNEDLAELLKNCLDNTYTCELEYSVETGRVYKVDFKQK